MRGFVRPWSPARLGSTAAVLASVAAAAVIVAAQPIQSPWWTYADADATYSAAGLNLLDGVSIRYLDHPGLPLEELVAVVFGAEHAVESVKGSSQSTSAFVDQKMLHLEGAKATWRSLAIVFYLTGAALSALLTALLFGRWWIGLVGGLLWLGAPGLAEMSIQYRPDVPLAVLLVLTMFLLGRAAQSRSAATYGWACVSLGLATMVKMPAAGLLPAVAILAFASPPERASLAALPMSGRAFIGRHRVVVGSVLLVWILIAGYLNRDFRGSMISSQQELAFAVPALVLVAYAAGTILAARIGGGTVRRVFDPFFAYLGLALFAGILIPVTFDVPDGLTSIIHIKEGLTGGGINAGIPFFGASWHPLVEPPLRQALIVFLIAGVAAVVGLVQRTPVPLAWFASATLLGLMAQARLADLHYFAPAYVVSMFGALWLAASLRPRALGVVGVVGLLIYVVTPQFQNRGGPKRSFEAFVTKEAPSLHFVESRLQPGEVALAPASWPNGSVWYSYVVQPYMSHTPRYPYTFVESTASGAQEAEANGLRLAYYTGPPVQQLKGSVTTLQIGDIGSFRVRVLTPNVVRLLSGPGTRR